MHIIKILIFLLEIKSEKNGCRVLLRHTRPICRLGKEKKKESKKEKDNFFFVTFHFDLLVKFELPLLLLVVVEAEERVDFEVEQPGEVGLLVVAVAADRVLARVRRHCPRARARSWRIDSHRRLLLHAPAELAHVHVHAHAHVHLTLEKIDPVVVRDHLIFLTDNTNVFLMVTNSFFRTHTETVLASRIKYQSKLEAING